MKCLFDADVDIKKKARSKIVMVRIYIDKSKLFESKKVKKRFFDCIKMYVCVIPIHEIHPDVAK